ncbi:MAG: pyridoxal phosphate-dependent aminotransferase [Bacteroidota bacterium]
MQGTLTANRLSDRINSLEESQTIGMAKKARELAAKGHDVINLSFGEPDFQTPQYIKDAAKKAIDEGFTFYTPVPGYPDLRKAISDKLLRDNNLSYPVDQIVVSTGAKQSIANAILCLINPGDEVIILGPYWVSYLEVVKLAGGVPVVVSGDAEQGFKATATQIEAAVTGNTRVIIYSSPCNPTGAVFNQQELSDIADVVLRYENLYVIADEIYEHINFTGAHYSMAAIPAVKERVITINGLSKAYAMTGWRVGYMAAEKWITDACDKMQGQITSGTCSIAQKAATAALNGSQKPTEEMSAAFLRRRDLVVAWANAIPGVSVSSPDGAFYIFPKIDSYFGRSKGETVINNSTDLAMYILNTSFVSVVPGDAFGDDSCIRISFAASDAKLKEAFERIAAALAELK